MPALSKLKSKTPRGAGFFYYFLPLNGYPSTFALPFTFAITSSAILFGAGA